MIRFALIGGGPKSHFTLLALHDCLPASAAPHIAVDVYDPLPPGSGSVWRHDQPDVLRLNVHAGVVDASSSMSRENFVTWMNRVAPEMSGEKYPPRALVGRYLREQFQLLTQYGNVTVARTPFVATGVERAGPQGIGSGVAQGKRERSSQGSLRSSKPTTRRVCLCTGNCRFRCAHPGPHPTRWAESRLEAGAQPRLFRQKVSGASSVVASVRIASSMPSWFSICRSMARSLAATSDSGRSPARSTAATR